MKTYLFIAFALVCAAASHAQDQQQRRLRELVEAASTKGAPSLSKSDGVLVADWLRVNGESLKNVKPWKTAIETSSGGMEVRFAQAKNALYVFVMGVPKQDLRIKELATSVHGPIVGTVTLLGSAERVSWEQEERELLLELPHTLPSGGPVVFKITWTNYYVEKPLDKSIKILVP